MRYRAPIEVLEDIDLDQAFAELGDPKTGEVTSIALSRYATDNYGLFTVASRNLICAVADRDELEITDRYAVKRTRPAAKTV